jgi:hypothetical protein
MNMIVRLLLFTLLMYVAVDACGGWFKVKKGKRFKGLFKSKKSGSGNETCCKLHPQVSRFFGGSKNGKFEDPLKATLTIECAESESAKRRKREAAAEPFELPVEFMCEEGQVIVSVNDTIIESEADAQAVVDDINAAIDACDNPVHNLEVSVETDGEDEKGQAGDMGLIKHLKHLGKKQKCGSGSGSGSGSDSD